MPTGGTTGMPKGVMNTHRSIQTFVAHFMIAIRYGRRKPGQSGGGADDAHRGRLSLPCTARGGTVVVVTSRIPALLLRRSPSTG